MAVPHDRMRFLVTCSLYWLWLYFNFICHFYQLFNWYSPLNWGNLEVTVEIVSVPSQLLAVITATKWWPFDLAYILLPQWLCISSFIQCLSSTISTWSFYCTHVYQMIAKLVRHQNWSLEDHRQMPSNGKCKYWKSPPFHLNVNFNSPSVIRVFLRRSSRRPYWLIDSIGQRSELDVLPGYRLWFLYCSDLFRNDQIIRQKSCSNKYIGGCSGGLNWRRRRRKNFIIMQLAI